MLMDLKESYAFFQLKDRAMSRSLKLEIQNKCFKVVRAQWPCSLLELALAGAGWRGFGGVRVAVRRDRAVRAEQAEAGVMFAAACSQCSP